MSQKRAYVIFIVLSVLIVGCVVLLSLGIREHVRSPSKYLEVSFLDVGQGDAIFIETPSGIQVLIDGGPDASVLAELATVMPWYDRSIDMVIATHMDRDHIGGLNDVLLQYKISRIGLADTSEDASTIRAFMKHVENENAEHLKLFAGQEVVLDVQEDITLEILWPDRNGGYSRNDGSIVARLVYGDTEFVFTGDISDDIEEKIVATTDVLQSDVLKVSHHGSRTSTSDIFLNATDAELAIISVECDSRYGHPHQEVLDTLYEYAIEYVTTCDEGTITLQSDGEKIFRE